MFNEKLIKKYQSLKTPFYYYDIALLRKTLEEKNLNINHRKEITLFIMQLKLILIERF